MLNYCLSDYLWAHAVLLLGPTIATLGLSIQIPVAALVEVLLGRPKWLANGRSTAMMVAGTLLIMAGFFAGNLAGGGHVYSAADGACVRVCFRLHAYSPSCRALRWCCLGSQHAADDACDARLWPCVHPLTLRAADKERERRRLSGAGDGFAALDAADGFGPDGEDNGVMVIPVSTHASIRDRSPGRCSSSPGRHKQQQPQAEQQWRQHSPTRRAVANGTDGRHIGLEMSSLSSSCSTPSPASEGQRRSSEGAAARAANSAFGSSELPAGAAAAAALPLDEDGGRQQQHNRSPDSSPERARRQRRASRLQRTAHYDEDE